MTHRLHLSRWDIQRIREQRMFQRLQQRMNRKKIVPETEPELSSFYPDTEDGASAQLRTQQLNKAAERFSNIDWMVFFKDFNLILLFPAVETIVITPFLPVVAFGRPLPKLSQQ